MKKLNAVLILTIIPAALILVNWVETLLRSANWDAYWALGFATLASAVSLVAVVKGNQRLAWISLLLLSFAFAENIGGTIAFAGFIVALIKDIMAWKPENVKAGVRFLPWVLSILGVLLIIGPITIAFIFSPIFCGPYANESNCALAVLPWATFFTAPAGILVLAVGLPLSVWLANKRKNK